MKFVLVTLLAAVASAAFVPLRKARERIDGSYIVVLKNGESPTAAVNNLLRSPLLSAYGGRIDRTYRSALNGFSATLSEQSLDYILSMDIVEYVEEDGVVHASDVASWGLDRIDARNGLDHSYTTPPGGGSNVHVYVFDTGIRGNHNDFGGRVVEYRDFINDGQGTNDCEGHGTHCAGTVGGATYGVAPEVSLHAIRVLNCQGVGSWSILIEAMEWVEDNYLNPAVASMSLGGGFSPATNDAVRRLDQAGVTVVVAAGNDNSDACYSSPASAPEAITVAATDDDDTRSYYSNYGSCVNIFAPGSDIKSTGHTSDTATTTKSGTSMACPHVAGAVALLLAQGVTDVKSRLISDATQDVVTDVRGSPNLLLYVE